MACAPCLGPANQRAEQQSRGMAPANRIVGIYMRFVMSLCAGVLLKVACVVL